MNRTIELMPYESHHLPSAAQLIHEVLSTPPMRETFSLTELLGQLRSDEARAGFAGLVALDTALGEIIGGLWWFALDGKELYERWRPRYSPREAIPQPNGYGAFIPNFGVLPGARNKGLGAHLLNTALTQLEATFDWIAIHGFTSVPQSVAILKSHGFEQLPLVGIQVQDRVCLIKYVG